MLDLNCPSKSLFLNPVAVHHLIWRLSTWKLLDEQSLWRYTSKTQSCSCSFKLMSQVLITTLSRLLMLSSVPHFTNMHYFLSPKISVNTLKLVVNGCVTGSENVQVVNTFSKKTWAKCTQPVSNLLIHTGRAGDEQCEHVHNANTGGHCRIGGRGEERVCTDAWLEIIFAWITTFSICSFQWTNTSKSSVSFFR